MRISIRHKIIITMMIVILVMVTVIGFISYDNSKKIILNQVKQSNYNILKNANDYFLKKFLSDMEYVVNYWAEQEEIVNWKNEPGSSKMVRTVPEAFLDIQQQWLGYKKGSSYIAWIYFGPEEDGSLFVAPLDPTMPDDYDCRERDWYKNAAMNRGKAVWSDPYIDAGDIGGIVVTVSRAVERNGKLIGAVGMDIKLDRWADIFDEIEFGDDGYLMLIDNGGIIFSHPDKEKLMTRLCEDIELCRQIEDGAETKIFNYKGSESILSHMKVSDTEWKLIGIMPINLSNKLAPIKNNVLSVAISSILFSFLVGSLLSTAITKPLSHMMGAMGKISEGDLDERIDIKSNDEFMVLGYEFNKMIDILKGLLSERDSNLEELTKMNEEIIKQSIKIKEYSHEKDIMNVELSRLLEEIKKNYLSTVRALANAIEASDEYTYGHCERVAKISMAIAEAIKLEPEKIHILEFASLLHDIGKIGISPDILNKKGNLTVEEYELIKQHPRIGYEILKDVEFLYDIRQIILQHHERIDGKGYPQGLYGDNITDMAKIMAIADAYDAMTSSRPYREKPLSKEEAIEELIKGKGSQFDAEMIDVFIGILNDPTIEL